VKRIQMKKHKYLWSLRIWIWIYQDLIWKSYEGVREKYMAKPSKGNIHHNTRKQYSMNIGLRSEARFPCYGRLKIKEMLKASSLSFNIGRCTSEWWLPDPVERSSSRTNHLRSILHSWTSLTSLAQTEDFRWTLK